MQPQSDAQLLRNYAEHGSEPAFTELVQRHTNLVYSAALRQVETPDIAAEITQNVFVSLARGAKNLSPRLTPEASLAGWLCRSAGNLSRNHRRDEFRRSTRERLAMEQLLVPPDAAPDWERLSRVLDDAMAELNETDYDALVLRFFQNQDFRTVGTAIGVSDDTAQKRVARALEKLRELLSQRGIRTTAGALGIVITANAVQAAPVGLAVTISAAAFAGTAAATSTIITATTKTIAMTTLQKTLVTSIVAVLAGAGLYEARQAAHLRDQVQTLQQQHVSEVQQLQDSLANATNRLANLVEESSHQKTNQNQNELLKLRGDVTRLRSELALAQSAHNALEQQANSSSAPTIFTFPAGQTFQLDPAKLRAAGIKATPPVNLDFKDVAEFQNAGNATVEAGAQTALWEVLKNEGRGFDKIAAPGSDTADETVAKLYGHLAVELSGATHVAFEKPAQMSQDFSLVNFFASGPKDQNGNYRSTSGLLGLRRQGDGWYLDRFTPQSQGLMIQSPAAVQK